MKKQILFIAGTSLSPFNTMVTIAKYILENSEYEPFFVLSSSQFESKISLLEQNNISYKKMYGKASNSIDKNYNLLRKIYKTLQKSSLFLYLNHFRIYKSLVNKYQKILNIFNSDEIQAVFIPCDRCGGYENLFLKFSKEYNIKSFVFPYAYTDPISRLDRRFDKNELIFDMIKSPWLNYMIQSKYPKQIFEHDNKKALFYTSDTILAMDKFGSLPLDPWNIGGSGMIDYICIQGEQEKDKSIQNGVIDHLYITGHPEHNLLYKAYEEQENIKDKLITQFNLDKTKKIIILALPQWYENKILDRDTTDKYHKLFIDSIMKCDINLLVSLHPKMEVSYYEDRLKGINILEQSLSSCLPIADIFVSGFVGTATWAMLLEIPTILMNEFDFKYEYIMKLEGILKTDTDSFENVMVKLINDSEYYNKIKNYQIQSAKYFAKFDGKVNQRFLELIEE